MAYYQPQLPRGAATPVFSYAYPAQDSGNYGYAASPASPSYPVGGGNYYPPSSSHKRTSTAAYYPPSSSSAFPAPPPAPRRRSASFSSPAVAAPLSDPKKKEMLYRHINLDTPKQSSSSKPRRFSKTHANDVDYEYLYGPADDHLYVSGDDSTEDDYFWENNKEKLSQRFQRPGLRRSATGSEKVLSSGLSTRQVRGPEVVGLTGLKMPSSPRGETGRGRERTREVPPPSPRAPTRERSAVRTRERSAVRTREMSLPRAPRPPAPQRTTPPPPPTSNISYGSSSSHERHGGHRQHHVREERREKSWMNINGNKISVDHKGVKINGQRYEAPGGRGVFNVGGIKVRVEGRDISLI